MDLRNKIDNFIGKHMLYKYENGWIYEIYIKNKDTIEYRVHSGAMAGRWVKDQKASIVNLSENVYKITWEEVTGSTVVLCFNIADRISHGTAWFPKWIIDDMTKVICCQNDCIDETIKWKDNGQSYPKTVVDEFSKITFIEDCGPDRNDIINCSLDKLPEGYATKTN